MGAVMARRHPRRGAGSVGSGGAVDREKASRTEGVNQRRKRIFANTPMTCVGRAPWADKVGFGLREERGQWGQLGRRPSGPVRLAGPKVKKKDF
jgi:hypothetical protein